MRTLIIACFLIIFSWEIGHSFHNPVLPIKINGSAILAEKIVEGPISLYVFPRHEKRMVPITESYFRRDSIAVANFIIEIDGELEEIHPTNYKKMIRKHLVNAPYLHQHLGKTGFRYENIPYMIQFYNKFRTR